MVFNKKLESETKTWVSFKNEQSRRVEEDTTKKKLKK